MTLSTPVVLLLFNRPDLTQRVFDVIATAKPETLLVVADGPRTPEERELCEQARSVVDHVDWDCEVLTDFSDENLGCGRRVSSGVEWVFSKVDEAIFLEDDCLPDLSFFTFCQSMLERYRHDQRIMTINGNNFQSGQKLTDYSYHFSKYPGCWGWASWRRAWEHYDYEMKTWPEFRESGLLAASCADEAEQRHWTDLFDSMHADPDKVDTWDHQWKYACWSQGGLAIEPSVNLVANLGLGRPDATHTSGTNPHLLQLTETQAVGALRHPPFVVRHNVADARVYEHFVAGGRPGISGFLGKISRGLSRFRSTNRVGHSDSP